MDHDLIGVHEVAELAGVGSSAVANWRSRSTDFPVPLAELKAGPVWRKSDIQAWLNQRDKGAPSQPRFFPALTAKRGDSPELIKCCQDTVDELLNLGTSEKRPGILLGRIQSGKTRAFLGVMALAFDRGFDVVVILTKGTVSLGQQTVARVRKDFQEFIQDDLVQVHDIMALPDLTPYELNQKLILVVKKEDDNMRRLLTAIETTYPELQKRRLLIIDDEADMASVTSRVVNGELIPGVIATQIDKLRTLVPASDFLQVTATPYALYLQPEEEVLKDGESLFLPRRPAFTVLLPTHAAYVGGEHYFEKSDDPQSPAYYFHRIVPPEERDALKKEDRRRFKIENCLSEKNVAILRDAILSFIVGGVVRRMQQAAQRKTPQKYSFLFHTESSRESHSWQQEVVVAIRKALEKAATGDTPLFADLMRRAYDCIEPSLKLQGPPVPSFAEVKKAARDAILGGHIMVTKVNSDNEINKLLDESGQLRLRNPLNIFIGGQILDRGITINNLIGFYYGRNPKRAQQDTTLQHSRMYGSRAIDDLGVTRFYAPLHIYQRMRRIHEFDTALREAFESGAHDRGVYFIRRDLQRGLIPCSPNKLKFSEITSIRPGGRLLPVGFQTVSVTAGKKSLDQLDKAIAAAFGSTEDQSVLVDVAVAISLLEKAFENLEPEDDGEGDLKSMLATMEHFSLITRDAGVKGKVWLIRATDRNVERLREEGRFSNAPDTKQQADLARSLAKTIPALMMLRQNGLLEQGWRGLPFWWPVVVAPANAVTSIFAADQAATDGDTA